MNRPRELAHKRPAEVVRAHAVPPPGRVGVLSAGYMRKWALLEEANRQADRGEVVILGPCQWVSARSRWEVPVRRLKEPPPAWRKPVLVGGGVLGILGGLVGAGWWLLATLAALPGAVLLGIILATFVAFVAGRHGGKSDGSGVDVSVTTSVRVRVR